MAKLKLTKHELKKQKDNLKRFFRYLPTLQLKKQQLQTEAMRIMQALQAIKQDISQQQQQIDIWVDVFAENVRIEELLQVEKINTITGNIAGVDVPNLESINFKEAEYDFVTTPLWVDEAIIVLKQMISLNVKKQIIKRQLEVVKEELRITTQRVNLFEKVKIPQSRENIRKIQIYLGDLQTASVVRGKIAKAKFKKVA